MDTQSTLPATRPAPPTPATPATPAKTQPQPGPQLPDIPESQLDPRFHEAYRQKLAGRKMQQIADSFKVDRVTVWRWCRQVESEALAQLADEPVFNLIVREVNRLTDLEEQAREAALNTKSDRAKAMLLSEARRTATARQNLLVTVGIYPKVAEQVFRVTATMKPHDLQPDEPEVTIPRKQALSELIEALQRGRQL